MIPNHRINKKKLNVPSCARLPQAKAKINVKGNEKLTDFSTIKYVLNSSWLSLFIMKY